MCMSVPDGYGSISSWYQWRSSPPPGGGFGVWKARSSSQTRCHFSSICFGSYLGVFITIPGTKKPLVGEAVGSSPRPASRGLPALEKELLLVHAGVTLATRRRKSHSRTRRKLDGELHEDQELHEAQPERRGRGPGSEVRHVARDGVPPRPCPARPAELGRQLLQARAELPRPLRAHA